MWERKGDKEEMGAKKKKSEGEKIKKEPHKKEEVIAPELLDILACPKCKGDIELDEKNSVLICRRCAIFYRIEDGIPIMLIDEARPISELSQEK